MVWRVQSEDFDSWVFHLNPVNHFCSGLFRCCMPEDKEVVTKLRELLRNHCQSPRLRHSRDLSSSALRRPLGSFAEALSNQHISWCCIDRLSLHDLPGT